MKASLSLIKIAMGCDLRIPRNALGYIDDLRETSAPEIIEDRLMQLARYAPDLVGKYRACGKSNG